MRMWVSMCVRARACVRAGASACARARARAPIPKRVCICVRAYELYMHALIKICLIN